MTHLAVLSSAGRLLILDLAELPNLNKGKGNKLIQLEGKEQILSMTTLNLDEIIQVVAGQQHLKLKGDDLQNTWVNVLRKVSSYHVDIKKQINC